jgi:hypothetical protein
MKLIQELKYQFKPILFGLLLIISVHGFSNGWWGLGFIFGGFLLVAMVIANFLLLMGRIKENRVSIIIILLSFSVSIILIMTSEFL